MVKGEIMRIRVLKLAAVAMVSSLAWGEEAPSVANLDIKPQEHYGRIARKVAGMLPTYHVTQQPLGEEISQRAWTNLVTMYDYGHCVFLQSDLDEFEPLRLRIGDALRRGDVSFAYDIHKVFVHRLEECVNYVTNMLETTEFDFSVKEECQFDRKEAPWPATREERDEIWRKRIKNELLAQILSRELDDEEKAAGKKPRKKAAKKKGRSASTPSPDKNQGVTNVEVNLDSTNAVESVEKPEPTPKENMINKYRHYLAWVLTELDDEKVLERYLLAASMAYDPHSAYMAPMSKDDFDMDMNLSLCGVGAVLSQSMDDGALEIKEVMKGGPMAREGSIKEGDKIVGVGQGDDPIEDVVWKPMRKSIKKIRGKKDTKVVLEVTDKNGASRRKVAIIRDEIKLEDQAATGRVEKVVLNGVTNVMGYVKLPAFYGTMDKRPNEPGYRSCSFDVAKWVARFNEEGANGMVLDLRGNGGGSLREAVLLTALFVRPNPEQCPVVQRGRRAAGHRPRHNRRRHAVARKGDGADRSADGAGGQRVDEDHHRAVLPHQRLLDAGEGRRERHPPAVCHRRAHRRGRGQAPERAAVVARRAGLFRPDMGHGALRRAAEGAFQEADSVVAGVGAPLAARETLPRGVRAQDRAAGAGGPQEDDEGGPRRLRRG